MELSEDKLIFWGTRGGLPSGEITSAKYGLATSCVELSFSDRHIIIDAGSGISLFGKQIDLNDRKPIDILIGHYHYDHLIGLPFFYPYLMEIILFEYFFQNFKEKMVSKLSINSYRHLSFL